MAGIQGLGEAFALERADPVAIDAGEAITQSDKPVKNTGDDISSTTAARFLALLLLGVGVVIAWLMKEKDVGYTPGTGFVLFAGFYVAAQTIERLSSSCLWESARNSRRRTGLLSFPPSASFSPSSWRSGSACFTSKR